MRRTRGWAEVCNYGQMAVDMRVFGKMAKRAALVASYMLMVTAMRGCGAMVRQVDRAYMYMQMGVATSESSMQTIRTE